jgi:hypothetical protein
MNGKWWLLATAVILEPVEIELLLNRQKRRLMQLYSMYRIRLNRAFAKLPLRVFSFGLNHSSESRAPQLQWSGTVLSSSPQFSAADSLSHRRTAFFVLLSMLNTSGGA